MDKNKLHNHQMIYIIITFAIITMLFSGIEVLAGERVKMFPGGDFDHWNKKEIKESRLIGGKVKTLYKINGGQWSSSNAHAKAFGIDKVSISTTPEKRGEGYCCRMETTLEIVTAIGIDLKALATGSVYTGKLLDIVGMKQSSDPNSAIDMGVPFTKKPKALMLDYKALIQPNGQIVFANAGTKVKNVAGRDKGQISLILQHRWEKDGHIYAYRVGSAHEYIESSTNGWVNNHRLPIHYGQYGSLSSKRHKAKNSAGKMVYVEEVGFRGDIQPTHIIIQISAGCQQPFTGCPGNIMWCDNIRLVYDE